VATTKSHSKALGEPQEQSDMIIIRATNTWKSFLYPSMALNVFALHCKDKEQTCS